VRLEAAEPHELTWLEHRAPCILSPAAKGIVARARGSEEPLAVVAFDNWTANAAWVHFAVRDPRIFFGQTIREAWGWVFQHVGVLLSTVRESNTRSIRLQKGLGFTELARIPDGYAGGEALIIMQLRREDAKHWRL
jgi:RimJ/RimL family protein N-acetyltransferase